MQHVSPLSFCLWAAGKWGHFQLCLVSVPATAQGADILWSLRPAPGFLWWPHCQLAPNVFPIPILLPIQHLIQSSSLTALISIAKTINATQHFNLIPFLKVSCFFTGRNYKIVLLFTAHPPETMQNGFINNICSPWSLLQRRILKLTIADPSIRKICGGTFTLGQNFREGEILSSLPPACWVYRYLCSMNFFLWFPASLFCLIIQQGQNLLFQITFVVMGMTQL